MTELLSCPFCGGEANIQISKRWPDGAEAAVDGYTAVCQNIDCILGGNDEWWADTEAEAVEAWNTRAERTCHVNEANALTQTLSMANCCSWGECSECGYLTPTNSVFCIECGAKVVDE